MTARVPDPEKPDYGPAVVDGHTLRYVSASAIGAFDVTQFSGCKRRWWFEKIDGRKTPQTRATEIGGNEHNSLRHYLVTGEDVLTHITRPGKHFIMRPGSDLIVEKTFGDYKAALAARERVIAGRGSNSDVEKYGIAFHGIPVMGAIDVRHRRGEYLDNEGNLWAERAPKVTAEVCDWKTSSNIRQYAKQAHQLATTVQMPLYAHAVTFDWPDLEFVRISHGSFGTRVREAQKVTTLLDRRTIENRVAQISSTVREMIDVAKATEATQVEPNLDSCDAYRGCPHSSYCDRPKGTVADLLKLPKGAPMSTGLFGTPAPTTNGTAAPSTPAGLFASQAAPTPPAPPAPPLSADAHAAQVAAARALLAQEDAAAAAAPAAPTVVSYGFCSACGAALTNVNASRLADGKTLHMGCTTLAAPPPAPITLPHIGAINPPDALPRNPVTAADPLPPAVIATITDPELKARAEAHAAAHAAAAASSPAAAKEKTSGRCSAAGQKIPVTVDEVLEQRKKWNCPRCNKEMKLKPEKDSDGSFVVVVGSHNMAGPPVAAQAPVPPAPPAVAAPLPLPVPPAVPVAAAPVPPPPPVVAVGPRQPHESNIIVTDANGVQRRLTQAEVDAAYAAPLAPPVVPPHAAVLSQAEMAASRSSWLEVAKTHFTQGQFDRATAAALIGLLEK